MTGFWVAIVPPGMSCATARRLLHGAAYARRRHEADDETGDRSDEGADQLAADQPAGRVFDDGGDLDDCLNLCALRQSTGRGVPRQSWRDDERGDNDAEKRAGEDENQDFHATNASKSRPKRTARVRKKKRPEFRPAVFTFRSRLL